MDENQETTAALDEAAAEAVADQEATQETEEKPEETTEEVAETTEEVVEEQTEELPQDHKERSDLGRKLSAYHRRVDEIDNKFERITEVLESLRPREKDPMDEVSPDEPITRAEAEALIERKEKQKTDAEVAYDKTYANTVSGLGPDLTNPEWEAVKKEMLTLRYVPSNDPERDAELNFVKAENLWRRKQMSKPPEKVNPLKGEKPKEKLGVATTQTSVTKETKQPKLDSYAQSYIDSVRRRDGDEYANKLLKD